MVDKEMSSPRILVVDIETSPLVAYSWGPKWETNLIRVLVQSQVICYSAKWVGGKQVTKALPDYKGYRPGIERLDDKRLVKDLHTLLSEADIVIGQNSNDFDLRTLNARFAYHGMAPPPPYKTVDTKREAKRHLRMPSNALDDMGDYFGLGRKKEHEGFALWEGCIAGEAASWKKMREYNAQDVILTEKLYEKLRPFMVSHPNVGMFSEEAVCPACGGDNLQWRGYSRTVSAVYRRFQCECGHWGRAMTKERSITNHRRA